VEGRFAEGLTEGQNDGPVRTATPPARQARLLMTGVFDLHVYGRMPDGQNHGREIVDTRLETAIRRGRPSPSVTPSRRGI